MTVSPAQARRSGYFCPRDTRIEQKQPVALTRPELTNSLPWKGKILVVEDQENVRAQIVEALTEIGCTVIEARDGSEGLRAVESGVVFDMLITDVGLPGLNGRQLADAARAIRPDLPILLVTGFAGGALGDWGLPAGMEVMRKPFALEELVARVRSMLPVKPAASASNP